MSGAHCCGVNASTKTRAPSLVLSSPVTIAAALPYLLGFHPRDSLISLWLRDREVVVVQRADLPADRDGAAVTAYLHAYLSAASGIGADEVVTVCVTSDPSIGESMLVQITGACEVPVKARLIVHGSRVRAMDGAGGWQWVSADARQHAEWELAHTTRPVRCSRSDVLAEVQFDPELVWTLPSDGAPMPAPHALEFLASGDFRTDKRSRLLRDVAMTVQGRDLIVWWCARSTLAWRRELLAALLIGLRATPPGESAHLACAAAAVAWMVGDGVRANAALDRCLEEEPEHLFATLVERAMRAAIPPYVFAGYLKEMQPHEFGLSQEAVDEAQDGRYTPA